MEFLRVPGILVCIFILTRWCAYCDDAYPPLITGHPSHVIGSEGSLVTLKCSAAASPPAKFMWLRNDEAASQLSFTSDLSLHLSRNVSDGVYRCLAKNDVGASLSVGANVTVAYLGNFDSSPSQQREIGVALGDSVVLTPPKLNALPLDMIRFEWRFFDALLYSNLTTYIAFDGSLVLLNFQAENVGKYTVTAIHSRFDRHQSSLPYSLSIASTPLAPTRAVGPYIVKPPKDQLVIKRADGANELRFDCVAGSFQALNNVQIQWKHNGTVIASDKFHYEISDYDRRLVVKNPNPNKDGGVYACETRVQFATLGSRVEQARAQVYEVPVLWPEYAKQNIEMEVAPGSSANMSCGYSGNPSADVRWYLNGKLLVTELLPGGTMEVVPRNGLTLRIRTMTDATSGVYQCEVYNPAGASLASSWLRTKPGAPTGRNEVEPLDAATTMSDAPETPPSDAGSGESRFFAQGPQDQSVIIGSNVVFPCEVAREVQGKFTREWYFKEQRLTAASSSRIEIRPDGTLVVRQVGPAAIGTYTCEISNEKGVQRQTARLSIVEKPGMPLHVQAYLLNDSLPARVELSWQEGFDGNSPIIKYLAHLRILGNQELWSDWETAVENIGRQQRRVVIDNLKPSAMYQFRVVAVNKFGPGIPSQASNSITMPQQPPAAAPRNVAGSARSSSSIMVQWQPPAVDQWNGDLTGFIVRYRLADYPDIPWIYRNVSDSRLTNVLLDDLITWREYEIQCAAYNNRGAGVFSKSQYITTLEGAPLEAPSHVNVTVVNSTAIRVEWIPPPQQQIPGVNQGYKIEGWRGNLIGVGEPAFRQMVLPLNLHRMAADVEGLKKYAAYNVTVVCHTTPGDGPRSTPIEIVTFEDVPGGVENLRFEDVLFSSVLLVWDPPEANGKLLNYTLNYWITNRTSAQSQWSRQIAPNATNVYVQGLTASTHYTFEIFATTVVGRGPSRIAAIESGVPPELPGRPSSLVVANVQPRSAYLQFAPGYDGKTIISKWLVEALIGQSTSWVHVYNVSAPQARALTVTGLRPWTSYSLRLTAVNVVGASPPSEATERFQTLQAPPEYAPEDFDVQPETSSRVKVCWTPLPSYAWNGVPKGYVLVYQKVNASAGNGSVVSVVPIEPTKLLIEDPGASEYPLNFLNADTAYQVSIAAFNELGQSEFTKAIVSATYEDVPVAFPPNIEAFAESPQTIRVRWGDIAPRDTNGQLLGYRIYYSAETPPDAPVFTEDVTNAEQHYAVLRGGSGKQLRAYTQYRIQLAAVTIVGEGVRSQPPIFVRTKEDTPGAPTEVRFSLVTTNEVRVVWKPPVEPNGAVLRYAVEYRLNGTADGAGNRTQLAPDLMMFAASGLQSERTYRFAISAQTEVGFGTEAVLYVVPTAFAVSPTAPGRPRVSTDHARAANHITLVWDSSDEYSNLIRFYILYIQPANGDWLTWAHTIVGTAKHFVVKGLKANTPYRFRLKAVNDYDQSAPSPDSDWVKTLEAEPGLPPTEIRAVSFGAQTAKVMWKPPPHDSWNSDAVGYRILFKEYRSASAFESHELPIGSALNAETEYTIERLNRFKHYIVVLQAFNTQGSSPRSRPAFVFVGYSIPKLPVAGLKVDSVSSTQLRVAWDWSKNAEKEAISGFRVSYSLVRNAPQMSQEIVRATESGVTLRDLNKFAEYNVKVQPFNRAGDGPVVEAKGVTLQDRPGPVVNLRFQDILLDSVNVTWSPPAEVNGIIVGYLVVYETFKLEEEFVKKIQEKTTQNWLLANGLEPNVTYSFSVKAETAVGYGPQLADKVTIGPQPGSPLAPQKPSVFQGEDSVSLEWLSGQPGRGPIIAHLIQFLFVGMKTSENTVQATSSTLGIPLVLTSANPSRQRRQISTPRWETLTQLQSAATVYTVSYSNLQAGGVYRFRVIARNEFGVSLPSPPSEAVVVPVVEEKPFYLKWWFMVILALVSVFIITVVVSVLCFTGRNAKYQYEKRNSNFSLQLADGGIVHYELRPQQQQQQQQQQYGTSMLSPSGAAAAKNSLSRRVNHYVNTPPPRPEPVRGAYADADTIPVKRMSPLPPQRLPNLYDSVACANEAGVSTAAFSGATGGGRPSAAFSDGGGGDRMHVGSRAASDPDTSTTAEGSDSEMDKDVSSIAQHYATNDDAYKLTWQRARATATAATTAGPSTSTIGSLSNYMYGHNGNLYRAYATPQRSSMVSNQSAADVGVNYLPESVGGDASLAAAMYRGSGSIPQQAGANAGAIAISNVAGSRTPVSGFSSFV